MGVLTINKHLISIKDLSQSEIETILERGDYWAQDTNSRIFHNHQSIDNPVICNLFFEASTRTRFSFEVAAKKLGYHVLNFNPSSSSTQKGETVYDTVKTLEAMGVNIAIIRTAEENLLQEIVPKVKLALVNAGSGTKEHPSQSLLDLLTIKQHFGYIEGLNVAIIGDIKHSRVASSNIEGLSKLGAHVTLSGPDKLLPNQSELEECFSDQILKQVTVTQNIDDAIMQADIVMMLRVQLERMESGPGTGINKIKAPTFDFNDYHQKYGLTLERERNMKTDAMIMHPAPFNRGIEIDGDLVEGPRSLIYKQVANGVAVRMAILERALKPF